MTIYNDGSNYAVVHNFGASGAMIFIGEKMNGSAGTKYESHNSVMLASASLEKRGYKKVGGKETWNDSVGFYAEFYRDGKSWVVKTLTGMRKYYNSYADGVIAMENAGLTRSA